MSAPQSINKLKAAMQGMAAVSEPAASMSAASVDPHATEERASLAPSRRGKRNVSAYIDTTAAKQLRLLAVEQDTSTQALVEEALNDLFRKHGKSAIA